ncbi:uncharacterized protein Eint_090435 [Encephalitozoon intestinalis ATCC 50506]|uniref:Uncharacterized protein n=1 Tax=Encephalitozoon intestinalis (strain ATCC 50506) TaxID=876142 RepID=W8P9D1_ENCIT|nr:uncharacterized protein Eint_090435 [Encephalitozoon intestinalis ATCC 50506]AHL30147.1 hypothetical protein Eint_090435 [Encephalitozoon intestinalis ATCC 50506]UTX45975.1 putative amyloid precursor-like protein [Encephalitozoon intestinalis]
MASGQRDREDTLYESTFYEKKNNEEQRKNNGNSHYFLTKLQLNFKSIFEGGKRFHSVENMHQNEETNS